MNSLHLSNKQCVVLGVIVAGIAVAGIAFYAYSRHIVNQGIVITTGSEYYGIFLRSDFGGYFSTRDENVRNIFKKYLMVGAPDQIGGLTSPGNMTDAERYGMYRIFYYDSRRFIVVSKSMNNDNIANSFKMYDMKDGKPVSPDCPIYAADLYQDGNIIMSGSDLATTEPNSSLVSAETGVCLYERGAPSFTFINLRPRLSSSETVFRTDPGYTDMSNFKMEGYIVDSGGDITDVNTTNRTLVVKVYDTTKRDAAGNYAYKRSIKVSY